MGFCEASGGETGREGDGQRGRRERVMCMCNMYLFCIDRGGRY
jgi:hypothetical protein